MQEADDICFSCRSFSYCRARARASAGATEHAPEGHNVLCTSASRTEGQGAPDKRCGRSVPHNVKRTQVGLRSSGHVHRCRQDSPPIALFPSVIASPSDSPLAWRVSAPSMLWKPAGKCQGDGRYGVGGGKAERATWFANPLGAGRKPVRRDRCGGTPKALGQSPS
jgi:hypothetical protein